MKLINSILSWFSSTFQKQGRRGKAVMGCLTLAILFCICSIPIAIFSPSTPTSAVAPTQTNNSNNQALLAETAVVETSTKTPFVQESSTPSSTPIPSKSPTVYPTITSQPSPLAPLKVSFIDVGQGDAILLQSPNGEIGLIDGGEADSGVVQYLQSLGITHLNLVIATHPHSDHIGGLVQVLSIFPVDRVVTNGATSTTLTYEHFLDAINASNADYKEAKRGDTISLGDLTFDVLSPISNTEEDLNDGSLVLRLVYGKVSFLFPGDAQETADDNMLVSGLDVSANILKVAHHGSRNGSPMEFIEAVRPQVAIYSAGAGNDFGHPHQEALDNLKSVGAQIYGTDINGTIIVTTDGNKYSLTTTKIVPTQTPTSIQPTVAPPTELFINVISLSSPINAGAYASLTINTLPGATCTITVYYKSGPSQAQGLGPQTADSSGNVTWSWKVGSGTAPGIWSIYVTADINGQSQSISIPFEVR